MTKLPRQETNWRNVSLCISLIAIILIVFDTFGFQTQDSIRKFHRLSYDDPATWFQNRWFGVLAQQNPNDAWIHQEIMWEVKPDFVIEAGTFHGGSALLWASILENLNPDGRVLTIDIEDHTEQARQLPLWQRKVDFFLGSSTDPKIIADISARVTGKKVLVILDSDHSESHVTSELQAYAPLVSLDSYLIVQDTNVNGHPVQPNFGPGPMEAVDKFMRNNSNFMVDRARERLLFTMHPKGYLKRVS